MNISIHMWGPVRTWSPVGILGCTLLLSASVAGAVLVPIGNEFRINSYTTGAQGSSVVAMAAGESGAPGGEFVVVWQGAPGQDGDASGIFAQRYDSTGTRLGSEFAVNTYTTQQQSSPSVAMAADGSFTVVWLGIGPGGDSGIFGRFYDSNGVAQGAELLLNDPAVTPTRAPASAATSAGNFLIAWAATDKMVGVRTSGTGQSLANFLITANDPRRVDISGLLDESFVVVWSEYQYGPAKDGAPANGVFADIHGQDFDADGNPAAGFQVNSLRDCPSSYCFEADGLRALAVSADGSGGFVVAHDSYVPGYIFNTDALDPGFEIGATVEPFRAFSPASGSQGSRPAAKQSGRQHAQSSVDVSTTPGGTFVVVWSDEATVSPQLAGSQSLGAGGRAVFARAFDCSGVQIAQSELQVDTSGDGRNPSVAITQAGDVVVVWEDSDDGVSRGIAARRFKLDEVCSLICGDADADGLISATDALIALRTAVGAVSCLPGRCDVDASLVISASDALRILQAAISQPGQPLACSPTT